MSSTPAIPFSLRLAEGLTLGLGLGTTALLVTIRLWTKLRLIRNMLPEDYISLVAFLAYAGGMSSLMVISINDYRKSPFKAYTLIFADDLLYCLIIPMIKVSILLQYKSIFNMRRGNSMHTVVRCLIYIVVICYMFIIVAAVVLYGESDCAQAKSPLSLCFARQTMIWAASGWFNVGSDVAILLLPLRPIWHLQVPWTRRIRIAAIFGLGIFACAASAGRAYRCQRIIGLTIMSPALGYELEMINIWSSAEVATGIVVGCLPILPRFIKEYVPGRRTSPTTARGRKPSCFTKLYTKSANIKGLQKDSYTSSSFPGTVDPRIHMSPLNLPQTPAQTYNSASVWTSQDSSSYEGRRDNRLEKRDESYMRLNSAERGEPARKGSSTWPETRSL